MEKNEKHFRLLQRPFHCEFMRPILTDEEYSKLFNMGTWMEALYLGDIEPVTDKQREFVLALKQQKPPTEENALLFWKFLKRKELLEKGNLKAEKVKVKDDREDWKKIRKMRF